MCQTLGLAHRAAKKSAKASRSHRGGVMHGLPGVLASWCLHPHSFPPKWVT